MFEVTRRLPRLKPRSGNKTDASTVQGHWERSGGSRCGGRWLFWHNDLELHGEYRAPRPHTGGGPRCGESQGNPPSDNFAAYLHHRRTSAKGPRIRNQNPEENGINEDMGASMITCVPSTHDHEGPPAWQTSSLNPQDRWEWCQHPQPLWFASAS